MIDTLRVILVARTLLIFIFLASNALGSENLSALTITNGFPPEILVSEHGKSYKLSIPISFPNEIEDIYDEVHIEDLTGDDVGEVIFSMTGGAVNSCSKVLYYRSADHSLVELAFEQGDLCNFRVKNGYIVSSYKSGAAWIEDIYTTKNTKINIKYSDHCIGCGEINRTIYNSDGSFNNLLVSDDADFEQRVPLVSKMTSRLASNIDYIVESTSERKISIQKNLSTKNTSEVVLWPGYYLKRSELCTSPGDGKDCSEQFHDFLKIEKNQQGYIVESHSTQANQSICSFVFHNVP